MSRGVARPSLYYLLWPSPTYYGHLLLTMTALLTMAHQLGLGLGGGGGLLRVRVRARVRARARARAGVRARVQDGVSVAASQACDLVRIGVRVG